jgi:hypothetical protein
MSTFNWDAGTPIGETKPTQSKTQETSKKWKPKTVVEKLVEGFGTFGYSTLSGLSKVGEAVGRAPAQALGIIPKDQPYSADLLQTRAEDAISAKRVERGLEPIESGALTQPQTGLGKAVKTGTEIATLFVPIFKAAQAAQTPAKITSVKNLIQLGKEAIKLGTKEAADMGLKTAVFSGMDEKEVGKAVTWGFAAPAFVKIASVGLAPLAKKLSDSIQKSTLRLSVSQKRDMGKKIDNAVEYLQKENIVGTPGVRVDKVKNRINVTEDALQEWLEKGDAKDVTIAKDKLTAQLRAIENKYIESGKTADIKNIRSTIDEAIQSIENFDNQIPASVLNNWKRSWYQKTYDQWGNRVLDAAKKDVGDIGRLMVENSTEGLLINGQKITDFNQSYGQALDALTMLKMAEHKSQVGILANIFGYSFGGAIAKDVGLGSTGRVGMAAGGVYLAKELLSTLPKTIATAGLNKLDPVQAEATIRKLLAPLVLELENIPEGSEGVSTQTQEGGGSFDWQSQ